MSLRIACGLTTFMVAGVVALVPSGAHAERITMADAAGDTQKIDWERSGKNDPVFLPAPEETSADIVRTVVAHGRTRLSVAVRFRDLTRPTEHETSVRVVTSDGDRLDVRLSARAGGRVRTVITRNDRAFSCLGLRAALEVDEDRVRLSLPTACLGAPRWVRVGVLAEGSEVTATEEHPYDFELYFDDGNSDTLDVRPWPVLGPRVRRG